MHVFNIEEGFNQNVFNIKEVPDLGIFQYKRGF